MCPSSTHQGLQEKGAWKDGSWGGEAAVEEPSPRAGGRSSPGRGNGDPGTRRVCLETPGKGRRELGTQASASGARRRWLAPGCGSPKGLGAGWGHGIAGPTAGAAEPGGGAIPASRAPAPRRRRAPARQKLAAGKEVGATARAEAGARAEAEPGSRGAAGGVGAAGGSAEPRSPALQGEAVPGGPPPLSPRPCGRSGVDMRLGSPHTHTHTAAGLPRRAGGSGCSHVARSGTHARRHVWTHAR